jgi:tetratricopeptide (TPR) repeat protein
LTQEVGVEQVYAAIEDAFKRNDLKKVEGLLMPALDQFPDLSRFWFYNGCLNFKLGYCAQAAVAFEKAIALDDAAHIYSNLGACYRRMNRNDEGLRILHQALDRMPNYAPALVNVGSMYVNEGCPEKGIPYLEKAVEIGGERGAVWNLGLLYLESCRFAEGFDCYREGVTHERSVRIYGTEQHGIAEPKLLDDESFREAVQSGRRPKLIVWGEQGIGDEIMFATIFPEAREHFDVVFECHPRLERLHRNAHPGLPLYPTRKDEWIAWPVTEKVHAEFKAPIGDLACYYRRNLASFLGAKVVYKPNPKEVLEYRARLEAVAGGRPIVGLATRGGVMQTARQYRTLRIGAEVDRLMQETDAVFVALDYDDMLPLANYIAEKYGEGRYLWHPAVVQHWDYEHTAALIAATDLTVTVCQSAAHLSAAIGHPTRVLCPVKCAWRYAPVPGQPDLWYWYPYEQIAIYRQDDPESWETPLTLAIRDINALRLQEAA